MGSEGGPESSELLPSPSNDANHNWTSVFEVLATKPDSKEIRKDNSDLKEQLTTTSSISSPQYRQDALHLLSRAADYPGECQDPHPFTYCDSRGTKRYIISSEDSSNAHPQRSHIREEACALTPE